MAKFIDKELYIQTIKQVISKDLTQKEEAVKLEITDRQVRRLIVKYKSIDEKAFVHKNINNQNAKKGAVEKLNNEFLNSPFCYI